MWLKLAHPTHQLRPYIFVIFLVHPQTTSMQKKTNRNRKVLGARKLTTFRKGSSRSVSSRSVLRDRQRNNFSTRGPLLPRLKANNFCRSPCSADSPQSATYISPMVHDSRSEVHQRHVATAVTSLRLIGSGHRRHARVQVGHVSSVGHVCPRMGTCCSSG